MTQNLKALARELANEVVETWNDADEGYGRLESRINSAILSGMLAAVTREPNDVQCVNGAALVQQWLEARCYNDIALCDRIYRAMTAEFAKELQG
jgi:hypothetical protein